MSAIHFYRRYEPDGRCKVICMRCFQTLGMAWDRHSVEEMESGHVCAFTAVATPATAVRARTGKARMEAPLLRDALRMHAWLVVLVTVLALYLLPTALEFGVSHALNPWLAVILPGDLAGCAVLVGLLRMPRTGVILYLLLTAVEGLSYTADGAVAHHLLWFADLVPTLLVLSQLLRMKLRSPELAVS
ncbi:MAG: hypothetical protein WBW84_12205 [Acidobacteriaceae bacterium]